MSLSYLGDIRDPSNLKALLPILAAATYVDTLGIFLWKRLSESSPINRWYSQLGLIAYSADILSLIIAIVLTQFITSSLGGAWNSRSIMVFVGCVVGVQMFHDLFFSKVVLRLIPSGSNELVDLMKDYVNIPFSAGILIVDALYCVLTALLAMWLITKPQGWSVLLLAVYLYVGMFILRTRPRQEL